MSEAGKKELLETFKGRIYSQVPRALDMHEVNVAVNNCSADMLTLSDALRRSNPGPTIKACADLMRERFPDIPELIDQLEHVGRCAATISVYAAWFDEWFHQQTPKLNSYKEIYCPCSDCDQRRVKTIDPTIQTVHA